MSQLKKGVLLNYSTILLTNIVGILLTPFILKHLGSSEYGIYLTIGAFVGTISLLDFGLSNTVVRFVAKYQAEKDKEGEENFLATTMLIYLFISLVIVIIGVVFYTFFLDSYFTKMNREEIKIAKAIFGILIFNLAIGLPGAAFSGICYSYESFVFPKALNIIRYITRSLTVVAVLSLGGKSIALVIIDTSFNILIILITSIFVFKKLKVKFKLHKFSFKFIKEIFSYSGWIFIFGLVALFQWQAGYFVLGRLSTSEIITIYGLGVTLGSYYGAFSTAISSMFLPRATKMSVNKVSSAELTNEMIKVGRLSFIVLMFIFGAFLLFGRQFVFLWVGSELSIATTNTIWLIALLIMIAYTVPLVQSFANLILEAQNKLAFKAILYLSSLIIGTGIGAYLVKDFGVLGMISGTLTGWVTAQVIMNFYYVRVAKLNILTFFKKLLSKILPALIISLILGHLLNYIPYDGAINFVIKAAIYTMVYSLITFKIGLNNYEKELFQNGINKVFKKK
ncbi:O-antigen/teichoic acid export membrane protein [Cellulophaga sp. RHA_52]|uniref:lipopolysaccharide biosynthesis protein n=1 Tax=Cellulophaga sp. RHA_52 TaxID=1250036 RepID=UPI001199E2A6|nr:oligosaccharide flippase family protein [Cellulophaga sp. RHA_52]TVZ10233.1 O-antigen/teichoic acid export membrane protein [Cellulophaga sp. RHA_52]